MPKNGFTLIELLVVIAIIGVLSSIVLTSIGNSRDKSAVARILIDFRSIQTAFSLLYADTNMTWRGDNSQPGGYPAGTRANCSNQSGISATDLITDQPPANPGWNGPYLQSTPRDPFGGYYEYDYDSDTWPGGGAGSGVRVVIVWCYDGTTPAPQRYLNIANDLDRKIDGVIGATSGRFVWADNGVFGNMSFLIAPSANSDPTY